MSVAPFGLKNKKDEMFRVWGKEIFLVATATLMEDAISYRYFQSAKKLF
jgi:hypothetical protein